MKTEWDYTHLAKAYLQRPDYSADAIDKMIALAGLSNGDKACDVGAGVAHLTIMLADRGLEVVSVEPNDKMREYGMKRTEKYPHVRWFEGSGEETGQPDNSYNIVTFGSSFNVTDRTKAMKEVARISRDNGWFAVMWNHRDLEDPVQLSIENIIKEAIPEYGYGTRREDQSSVIDGSALFGPVTKIEGFVVHTQTIDEVVEAWRSHATLDRQAGEKFEGIVGAIEKMLKGLNKTSIEIPYTTRIWMAQLK